MTVAGNEGRPVCPGHDASRRRFLALAAGAVPVLATASVTAGCGRSVVDDRVIEFGSLDEAMALLDRISADVPAPRPGAWGWARTLDHCAQSIEYAMTGYPQSRSRLFQTTVGAAAFQLFSLRGGMSHDLTEPIPGAAPLPANPDVAAATKRLRQAAQVFGEWDGPLQPHFAFGRLDKTEYDRAHAMHLANHFSAFRLDGREVA